MKTISQAILSRCIGIAMFLFLLPFFLPAQNFINVTSQVIPPYDGSFANFHTKVLVTVQNAARQGYDVQLVGRLTGNGITIEFRPNPDPVYFISGSQTQVISQVQLMPYFQEQNVAVTGITKDELYRGAGLPAGNYQLCFRARNALSGAFLSMDEPSGCFPFGVQPPAGGGGEVRLTTQVIPPYSTYLDDYINQNKLIVILQNQTGSNQSLRLTGSITGNNGVVITIPESFIPSRPIALSSRQVLQLTGNDLREYFSESVLKVEGTNRDEVTRGNGLPEGNYQWCFQVLDYRTGEPRSAGTPSGCSFFEIRQYEPPFTIQPACDVKVNAIQPQNILFTWSIPAGVRPDQVEYILKIIELYPQTIDPNQAMLSANVPPLLEKVIQANSYIYSLADPKLETGKKYAYRITARTSFNSRRGRRDGPLNFRNNGHSQVCTFTYGEQAIQANQIATEKITIVHEHIEPVVHVNPAVVLVAPVPQTNNSPDPEDSDECEASCSVVAPANSTSKNITTGDVIKAGKFTMTVTSGNSAGGTGTILMNFLNTPVNVTWNNIQVNTSNEMFGAGSKIRAVMDINAINNAPYVMGGLWNGNDVAPEASTILDEVQQANRRVSTFPANNQQATGLPLALDHGNFDLIILGLNFTPTEATMNAVTLIELINSTTPGDHLILHTSTCIRPNGFGNANQITLGSNKTIPFSEHASMVLNQNTTSASFDCQGIDQINLNGSLVFDRELVVPVNNDGEVIAAPAKVSAAFSTSVTNVNNWTLDIASLNEAFTIPSLVGFRMSASQITIDQSDTQTPPGINKPLSWRGLHIGSLQVVLNGIFIKNDNPLALSVNNFTIGNQGLSGEIDPPGNILQLNEGKIGTWPISVDNFNISINNSSIDGSTIEGRLKLPIAANELDYSITIIGSQSEDEIVDFQFNVQQATDLDVDMWFASIDLEETSTIGIQKVGDSYRPTADLTGSIAISWSEGNGPAQNNSVGNFEMPELEFEHLTIEDNGAAVPDINVGTMEVANADGLDLQLATFSAHFDPPGFVKNGNKIGLAFDIDLELIKMTNSLNGETAFTIFAEYEGNKFNYKETQLNKIALNGDVGVAQMAGEIDIYSNDATFGNGFRGEIDVIINALGGAGVNAVLQVGRVNSFNYWYFDVMANLGVAGFNIPGTMASIYGLGGGAYGNMVRSETPVQTIGELNDTAPYSHAPGANKDGLTFTPQQGTFGFSAAIAFGLTGASAAFNGDLKFSMELQSTGAVNHVILEGGCYMMQDITDRDGSGLITGTVYAEIEPRIPNATNGENAAANRPNFRFIAGMHMDIANGLIQGDATLDLWFCPSEWWIKLGEWQNEDVPWEDDSRMNITIDLKIIEAHFHSYFMMGSNIPGMPKMPLMVREAFEEDSKPLNPSPRIGLLSTNNPNAVPASPGIAFGAGSYFGADMKFLIFYADIDFVKGFDILLKKYANSSCGPNIGVNGWYAKGQAYFYLNFDVGVEIDIWVWEGKASILAATTAATIQAALPNPTWLKGQFMIEGEVLNGLFKFNTGFRFEIGEKCEFGSASPFDEMPIISDITPDKNEDDVSVYIVPETAFNFPKNDFSYDEEVDGELVTKTYKYIFKSFTLKYKEAGTNTNKEIDLKPFMNYRPGGLSATYYYPDMILPEHTNITYTIYVQGWQMAPGAPKKVHDETYTGTFTSGSWPAHIEPEQLVRGNPQYYQNFFLKNEGPTGFLEFKNPHPHFTSASWWYNNAFKLGTYSGIGSGSFAYKARFKELETNETYETSYSMQTPKRMVFPIPAGMKNNRIYQLEIVVRFTPPINSFAYGGPTGNVNQTYENVLITGQQGGGGMVAVNELAMQTLDQGNPVATATPANLQATAGNQQSSQQMLMNNYQALATVNPSLGPGQLTTGNSGTTTFNPAMNPTFGFSQLNDNENGTYIERKKNELIKKKTGEQGLEWPLFDDLPWYFKTSRFNTLQAKLNSMKAAGVVYHEYTGYYERFNSLDIVHEPVWGEGNQIPITTKVPVSLWEIEETFEKPYEVGGYSITVGGNENEQINVPPLVSFLHRGYDDWFSDSFYYSPTDPYDLPDWDEWAQFPYYETDDGMYLGHYAQQNIPFPGVHWENFVPQPFNNEPWTPDRHSGGNNAFPFGNQNLPSPAQVMDMTYKPTVVFYKNAGKHGNIDFGNKGVTWFKEDLLAQDAVNNAKAKGNQADPGEGNNGGVVFGGGVNFQGNVYGQVNTGIQQTTQLIANTKQHLAVIDYTEWISMRDFYLLQKYVYQMNEEEEGTFFTECDGSLYSNDNTTNCYYPGIKNWINNVWYYKARPAGTYYFRLGNEEEHRDFEIDLLSTLNSGN